jgi:hypothetical protein
MTSRGIQDVFDESGLPQHFVTGAAVRGVAAISVTSKVRRQANLQVFIKLNLLRHFPYRCGCRID